MGGSYSFVRAATCNLRERNDAWNSFYGGLTAGAIAGIRSKRLRLYPYFLRNLIFLAQSVAAVLTWSIAVGSIMGLFEWSGGLGGTGGSMKNSPNRADWREKLFAPQQKLPRSEVAEALGWKQT